MLEPASMRLRSISVKGLSVEEALLFMRGLAKYVDDLILGRTLTGYGPAAVGGGPFARHQEPGKPSCF